MVLAFLTLLASTLSAQTKTSIWNATAVPAVAADPDSVATELGVRFRSDVAGVVTGIRFYKSSTNTGTHTGTLWSNTGTKLATATFTSETASGWQEVTFAQPVAITANTLYVASYHTNVGHYSVSEDYFLSSADNTPLHAPADSSTSHNGLYVYGTGGVFPSNSYSSSNYWVDVAFVPNSGGTTTTYAVSGTISGGAGAAIALSGAKSASAIADASGNFSFTGLANGTYTVTPSKSGYTMTPTSKSVTVNGANVTGVNFTASTTSPSTYTVSGTITGGAGSTVTLSGTTQSSTTADSSGNYSFGGVPNGTYTVTPSKSGYTMTPTSRSVTVNGANVTAVNFTAGSTTTGTKTSIWSSSAVPAVAAASDPYAVELGVRFQSDVAGVITGIRFYKGSTNTGTHTGTLWSNTGTKLATATFTNETASGWQEVTFATPVAISANTLYVASYHTTVGYYAVNSNYFANSADNAPLHAPVDTTTSHNGLYVYGSGGIFPTSSYNKSNYWVDVAFIPNSGSSPATNYTVSGTVSGGSGATVALTGGTSASTTADASGNFTFSVPNGTYTVTPSKSGYTMTPANKSVTVNGANVTGVNFTATASTTTYAISGTISGGAGATVTLGGAKTASTVANSSGAFSFTGLANGTYTVTPTLSGYTMTPTNKSVTVNGANVTGVSFTAAVGIAHSVDINWVASTSSAVAGYKVYRSTTSGTGYTLVNSTPVTSTVYSDSNVSAGTTYYYVVRSVDSSGAESANSNQATAAVPTP